jgi:reactive intermediate/imine deaminase
VTRTIISTEHAPRAIGPYSQAVKVGSTVYMSGQIALDPGTGELVEGGIEAETRRVFDNLTAVARAAGGDLSSVVRFTVYLKDLGQFLVVNHIMAEYLEEPFPARVTIGVASLPRGAVVEIDAILEL